MTTTTTPTPLPDTLVVTDIDQFVSILFDWHDSKVALLRHMKDIPVGTPATIGDGEDVVMDGDLLKGFQLGLTIALAELGQLPFAAEAEEEAPAPAEAANDSPVQ